MNKNSLVLILISLSVLCLYTYQEIDDMSVLNDEYHKITNNSACMNYMRILTAAPRWRICVVFGLLNTLIIGGFLKINTNDQKLFWNMFWFSLVTSILIFYKFISHWQWHYVTNNGGLENSEYTKKYEPIFN
jgi:hypothetical protein